MASGTKLLTFGLKQLATLNIHVLAKLVSIVSHLLCRDSNNILEHKLLQTHTLNRGKAMKAGIVGNRLYCNAEYGILARFGLLLEQKLPSWRLTV